MVNLIFLWGKKLEKNFFTCDRDNIICCEKSIFSGKTLTSVCINIEELSHLMWKYRVGNHSKVSPVPILCLDCGDGYPSPNVLHQIGLIENLAEDWAVEVALLERNWHGREACEHSIGDWHIQHVCWVQDGMSPGGDGDQSGFGIDPEYLVTVPTNNGILQVFLTAFV